MSLCMYIYIIFLYLSISNFAAQMWILLFNTSKRPSIRCTYEDKFQNYTYKTNHKLQYGTQTCASNSFKLSDWESWLLNKIGSRRNKQYYQNIDILKFINTHVEAKHPNHYKYLFACTGCENVALIHVIIEFRTLEMVWILECLIYYECVLYIDDD